MLNFGGLIGSLWNMGHASTLKHNSPNIKASFISPNYISHTLQVKNKQVYRAKLIELKFLPDLPLQTKLHFSPTFAFKLKKRGD